MTPAGEVIVAGTLDMPMGPDRAVIANLATAQIILKSGDSIQGAPGTVDSIGLVEASPDGSHIMATATMSTGSEVLALDGIALRLGSTPLRIGGTIPSGFDFASGGSMYAFWGAAVGDDGQWILDLGVDNYTRDVVVRNGRFVDIDFGLYPASVEAGARGYALISGGESLLGDEAVIASDDSPVDFDGDGTVDIGWKIIEPVADPAGSGLSNPSFCNASINGDGVIYLTSRLTGPGYDGRTGGRLSMALQGTGYCLSEANSTGNRGRATLVGNAVAVDNELALVVHQLPQSVTGLGICSLTQGFSAQPGGSTGTLCLGGAVGRLTNQVFSSGSAGSADVSLTLSAMPQPNGAVQVMAGQRWNFQAWHRDSMNGAATSNFTDAVTVRFL